MAEVRTQQEMSERGEAAVVDALLRLSSAFVVLPRLSLPGQNWVEAPDDLDVVVLGPGGAVLLSYRHWHGTVLAAPPPGTWRLRYWGGGEEEIADPLPLLQAKGAALAEYLSDRAAPTPALKLALVFPARTVLDERSRIGADAAVTVLALDRLSDWIADAVGASSGDPTWPRRAADQLRPATPIRLVNQYQITGVLSHEPPGNRYLAIDTLAGNQVVLQELSYDPYQGSQELERERQELLREAKLLMELDHANVVKVERVICKDDRYYVVNRWLDGCLSLRERFKQGLPLPWNQVIELGIQLAAGLAYAHSRGVVHRDIRPENILTAGLPVSPGPASSEGSALAADQTAMQAQIANFQFAKKTDLDTRPTLDLRRMSQESPYSAPEFKLGQDMHHQVDARADVYSLGAVLYEALTGQLPKHVDEKYWQPPSQFVTDLPAGTDELIAKALRFDPALRFSTMNALRERLLHLRDQLPDHVDSPRLRYVDRRVVRRTALSLVYAAEDRKLSRQVALKRPLVSVGLRPDDHRKAIERLLRDAAAASHLMHPGIVQILDHFIEDDDPYIVMEWIAGQSVRELLGMHGGSLPLELALDVVEQVGNALVYAHGQGVIHGDIKPENVMLSGGRAVVLDFGSATRSAEGAQAGNSFRQEVSGTARYVAPEVLRGQEFDARVDVFALGVMTYELLTGRYPYPAQAIMGRYAPHVLEGGVAAPASLRLEVSSLLSAAVSKAIATDPQARHETMRAFLEDLSRARGGGRKHRQPGRLLLAAGGVALAVALVGALATWLLGPFFVRTPKQPDFLLATGSTLVATPSPTGESASAAIALVASAAATPQALGQAPSPQASSPGSPAPAALLATPASQLPAATAAPTSAPARRVWWASGSQAVNGVTVQVVAISLSDGQTSVRLRLKNDSPDPVKLLDRDGSVQVADSRGTDFSDAVDYQSVEEALKEVPAGQEVEGTFQLRRAADPSADALTVTLAEDEGGHRTFALKAYRVVERQ